MNIFARQNEHFCHGRLISILWLFHAINCLGSLRITWLLIEINLDSFWATKCHNNYRGIFWSKKICTYEIKCALLLFLFVGPGLLRGWRRRWLAVEDSAAIGWLQHLVFWSFIVIWKRIIIELPVSIHNWDAYITRPSLSLTLVFKYHIYD